MDLPKQSYLRLRPPYHFGHHGDFFRYFFLCRFGIFNLCIIWSKNNFSGFSLFSWWNSCFYKEVIYSTNSYNISFYHVSLSFCTMCPHLSIFHFKAHFYNTSGIWTFYYKKSCMNWYNVVTRYSEVNSISMGQYCNNYQLHYSTIPDNRRLSTLLKHQIFLNYSMAEWYEVRNV